MFSVHNEIASMRQFQCIPTAYVISMHEIFTISLKTKNNFSTTFIVMYMFCEKILEWLCAKYEFILGGNHALRSNSRMASIPTLRPSRTSYFVQSHSRMVLIPTLRRTYT